MARVRMRFQISGGRGNTVDGNGNIAFVEWPGPGEVLECGDAEAAQLVAGGMADPVEDEPVAERAARSETAEGDGIPATSGKPAARTAPRATAKP